MVYIQERLEADSERPAARPIQQDTSTTTTPPLQQHTRPANNKNSPLPPTHKKSQHLYVLHKTSALRTDNKQAKYIR